MNNKLFRNLFLTSIMTAIIATLFKLLHLQFAEWLLLICVLSTLSYVVVGIMEINRSTKISNSYKVIWSICLLLFNFVAAIFYLINRKNIV